MKKFLLATTALVLCTGSAWAQNTQCSDRALGDSTNACANTRFVQNAIAGAGSGTVGAGTTGQLAVYPANGTAVAGSNIVGADVFFKSGRPWVDVRAYASLVVGSDWSAAFQQANTDLTANFFWGGTIYVPPQTAGGPYCLNSGVTIGRGVQLVGAGPQSTSLSACGSDTTVVTVDGSTSAVKNMTIIGHGSDAAGSFTVTKPTMKVTTNTVGGRFENLLIYNGFNAIDYRGSDSTFYYVGTQNPPYGNASIYFGGTGWLIHTTADSQAPDPTRPTVPFAAPVARGNTTAYNLGDIRTLSGFYIQVTQAGTTGGSPPALQMYGTDINDGTVKWRLHSPVGACAIMVDTNAIELRGTFVDMTANTDYGLCVSNSLAGTAPGATSFDHSVIGTNLKGAINITAGSNFRIESSDIGQPFTNNTNTVILAGTQTGSAWIINNSFGGGGGADYGINNNSGSTADYYFNGNRFAATGQANIAFGNTISNFEANNNIFNGNVGLSISGTTHDFYTATGNVCPSITTCIADAGTGTHKQVFNQGVFGAAGSAVGAFGVENATSGRITVSPPAGALGTIALTWPIVAGTLTTTGNNLSVFSATTSAQLAGVISDETGTGSLVFATSPQFVTAIAVAGANGHIGISDTGTSFSFEDIAGGGFTGLRFGQEGSAGGNNLIIGSAAGDGVFSLRDNKRILFGANNTALMYLNPSGAFGIGTTTDFGAGIVGASKAVLSVPLTVATLPTCNATTEGARAYVTDQNTAVAYRGAVTGSGATRQAVLCSNSAWIQD